MSFAKGRLVDYLTHILEAIARIGHYTENMTEATFLESPMVQDAVIRNIEIIGEASHNITKSFPDFTAAHPEFPFVPAYEMRNAVAHGYFKVDLELVWNTILTDLPSLREQASGLVEDIRRSDD